MATGRKKPGGHRGPPLLIRQRHIIPPSGRAVADVQTVIARINTHPPALRIIITIAGGRGPGI